MEQNCKMEQEGRASYFALYERPDSEPQSEPVVPIGDEAADEGSRGKSANRVMLIPRIFHRVWLGSASMPEKLVAYGESWLKHHPGWEMKLWTEANLPKLVNQHVYERCRSYSEKSDVVRYEVLFQYGGVYLDTDVECQRNIEPLLAGVPAFAAIEQWGLVGTAIVGAAKGHPLLLEIIRGAPESFRRHEGDPVASMGPRYLTGCVFDYLDRNPAEVYVFDLCFFYPYGHWETHRCEEPFPWAFAIHHWAGSWYR